MKLNVGIFIFDGAEVLDFAGPFEVFSVASQLHEYKLFNVFTLAGSDAPVIAVNGLSVNPDHTFKTAPNIDILIIAGGQGTNELIKDKELLNKIRGVHEEATYTLSICSGSRVLAVLGLLDGKSYCTHHQVYDDMKKLVPDGIPKPAERFTGDGTLFTSGGISAGIDLSFHLLTMIYGKEAAHKTATYMEYELR
ncbi:DJ-1/PfpI family protein [Flavobacteriaceae bacterium M23B6Z8]